MTARVITVAHIASVVVSVVQWHLLGPDSKTREFDLGARAIQVKAKVLASPWSEAGHSDTSGAGQHAQSLVKIRYESKPGLWT
jgi:O-glycosyl hydrolase